jgi:sugar-specific transcriptional regulator TrmB
MNIYAALKLTSGEEKVYEALVIFKSSTTGPLYKHANVSQSKIIDILNRLKKKGLAASIIKEGKTYWHPANPTIYLKKINEELEELQKRKEVLDTELPAFIKKETYPQDEAQVLTGYHGFRSCMYSFLDTFNAKETFLVFGSPVPIPEPFVTFLQAFNLERIEKKIKAKFLYGENLKAFAKKLYTTPKTELRFMTGLTPSTIAIGKDRIIIMTWEEKGKFIVIMGKEISDNYAAFFKSLWDMAKK